MQINNKTLTGFAAASLLTLPLAGEAITWDAGDLKVNFHGSLRPSLNVDDCSSPCQGPWRNPEDLTNKKSTYLSGNFSHIQFDGSYKINEKNSVVFKTEWKIDLTESSDTRAGENDTLVDFEQYLGMKGGYGMFRAGTILTPYMQSGVKLDPFRRDSIAGRFFVDIYSGLHHTNGFGRGRATNTIRYDSPKFLGGWTAQIFLSLDESSNDDHARGAGVMYNHKNIYGFLQYYDANQPGKSDATKIGGKYKFGKKGSIFGQYESDGGLISLSEGIPGITGPIPPVGDLRYTDPNTVEGADLWLLGGTYNINKFELIAQYGERDDAKNSTNPQNGHTGLVLGGAYRQTKNVYHYAGYLVKDFNDAKDQDKRFTVGTTFTW